MLTVPGSGDIAENKADKSPLTEITPYEETNKIKIQVKYLVCLGVLSAKEKNEGRKRVIRMEGRGSQL